MIGRLGKEAAEIALQFLADGMPLDDAVRSSSALMGEPLSDAANKLLRQNSNVVSRTRTRHEPSITANYNDGRESLTAMQRAMTNQGITHRDRANLLAGYGRPQWTARVLADKYAVGQLLLDAAQGDPDVAALIAKRLGFGGVL